MKSKMSKLLSFLIILTMIVSSTGLVFAGEAKKSVSATGKAGAEAVYNSAGEVSESAVAGFESANKFGAFSPKKATPGNYITVTEVKSGTDAEFEAAGEAVSVINYNATNDVFADATNFCGYSQKVTLKKGTLMMLAAVQGDGYNYYASGTYGLFYDAELNNPVGTEVVYENDAEVSTAVIKVPKDGTYYIGIYSCFIPTDYPDFDVRNYSAVIVAMSLSGKDRTVYSGKRIAVGQIDSQTNTFTFKATKNGYIKLTTTDVAPKFRLYSSKNKALSKTSVSCSSIVYGVKKGNTYKIKVAAPYNSAGGYTMLLTNTSVSESSGSTKSKAKTIYRGSSKAKKGYIVAGSSTPDYYKFKLTGSKAVNIKMSGATNETIKIAVYKGSKHIKTCNFNRTTKDITIKSVGKWKKGTYYIKVYRGNSTSSGHYKVYWYYR